MLRNYLIVAYRNLMRHKVYSLINVAGLSIGIAFCILTFLYVRHEWSFDAFHDKADRIYRVYTETRFGQSGMTPDPLGPALEAAFPDIRAVRIGGGASSVKEGDRSLGRSIYFADPTILEVFTFPLLKGDPATVLEDPYSLVITDAAARKYFGDEDPIGKVLSVDLVGLRRVVRDLVITGIAKTIPKNSSIRFDFLAPFAARGEPRNWRHYNIATYVLLSEHVWPVDLEEQFPGLVETWFGEDAETKVGLQPLLEVHFNRGGRGPKPVSDPVYAYVLIGMSLMVLVIACVNFMTLAVGRSFSRDREVAMRRVSGASRTQLTQQFLGESMLLSVMALITGVVLAELLLPAFNNLVGMDLALRDQTDGAGLAFLVGLSAAVGLAAGGYPAFVLSGFQPVVVLGGRHRFGATSLFARAFVVIQLAISACVVVSALLMVRQLEYLKTKPLGFDSEHVLRIPIWNLWQRDSGHVDVYRNELMRYHTVMGITTTTHALSNRTRYIGNVEYQGEQFDVELLDVGDEFLKTMGFSLLEGADFDPRSTDSRASIVVNEELVRRLGWKTPVVGRKLRVEERDVAVIGVVQDFHVRSLHHRIGPAVLRLATLGWGMLFVRIRAENIPATLAFLKEKWREVAPGLEFQTSFLEDEVNGQYKTEDRLNRVLQLSALLAVFIACLGAFGLTALAVARRTREIGIRKVLGARVFGIVSLLSRDFVKLVLIASLIAFPVAYYATEQWLRDFAYRIDPQVSTFALGGGIVLLAVLLTVSVRAIRAAWANPVDALRTE